SPVASNDWGGKVTEDASSHAGEKSSINGNVLSNDHFGADGQKDSHHDNGFQWNVSNSLKADIAQYGTLKLNDDGTWSFKLNNNSLATQGLNDHDAKTFELSYTITDGDGDTSTATLKFTIEG